MVTIATRARRSHGPTSAGGVDGGRWVPHHEGMSAALPGVPRLADLVSRGGVVVLSGAGLSTESGIPDYRGATGVAVRRQAPMTYLSFTTDPLARRRYWARGHLGWQYLSQARPNTGHRVVADLEHRGLVTGVVTQNVDGLHSAAGSRQVLDLHGRLDRVRCLACGEVTTRAQVHRRLSAANASWQAAATAVNPDGDTEVPEDQLDGFTPVDCERCGGLLKPDVVYFGESVPVDRVTASKEQVDGASMLLVLGSSLTVFSGRRLVVRALRGGTPVAIVNDGQTRCDDEAVLKLSTPLGATLEALQERVVERGAKPVEAAGRVRPV